MCKEAAPAMIKFSMDKIEGEEGYIEKGLSLFEMRHIKHNARVMISFGRNHQLTISVRFVMFQSGKRKKPPPK